jgi:hypothetical protein
MGVNRISTRSSVDELFLERLALALRNARLDAIVVGNVASILNGAPVLTQDVDLLVRDTALNRKKLRSFAKSLHATSPSAISELATVERIYGARVPIDILFDHIPGKLTFASVKSRARPARVGSEILIVAALADVIKSKIAAGRPKDKAVLPVLHNTLAARRAEGLEK